MVSVKEKGYDHLGGTFVFCPNCGTQNESAATPCKKCGFKLSGISVPKFKGTMVMNSDQTVAEMIEEHRKRQVQGGPPADKSKARTSEPAPRRSPGSSAPPSSLGGPRGPVLQPPRVSAPTRGRMGGTMLGVAPQVGGHAPAAGAAVPPGGVRVPPPTPAGPAAPSPEPSQSETVSSAEAAVPSPPPPAASSADAHLAGTPQPSPADLDPSPAADAPRAAAEVAASPAPTRPLPAMAGLDAAAPGEPAEESAGAQKEPTPAAPRAVPVTAPLPRVSEASSNTAADEKPAPAAASIPPTAPRLRPIDIVLIICTFGVYGLVLWARQRKPAP